MSRFFFRFLLLLTFVGMVFMTLSETGFAAEKQMRFISMTGHGTVSVAPDRVEISLGVESRAKTAKEALELNTQNMNRVIATLKEGGIEEKYIQTNNFSVRPNYVHSKNSPPKIRGYSVDNTVRIHVKKIDKLGDLLDRVVTAGSNQIHGIRFLVSNEDELKDKARTLAVKAAQRKAALYAKAAGVELGDVVSLVEGVQSGRPQPMARTMMEQSQSVPIAGGEQELSVQVTITWEIK